MIKYIYLSGPMTGYPDFNRPLFHEVAAILRGRGHTVYNPAEYSYTGDVFPLGEAMAEYLTHIGTQADTIVMLPGWENSKGASIEHSLAVYLGLEVEMWGAE